MKKDNLEILTEEEVDILKQEVQVHCFRYGVPSDIIKIRMNNHMKTSGGHIRITYNPDCAIYQYSSGRVRKSRKYIKPGYIKLATINLSTRAYEEFGFQNILLTLRHEIAHYITEQKYGELDHCETFKRVCAELDGSMNRTLAGEEWAEWATMDYCKTLPKFRYTCPKCGLSDTRKKRYPLKYIFSHICVECDTPLDEWKVEDLRNF